MKREEEEEARMDVCVEEDGVEDGRGWGGGDDASGEKGSDAMPIARIET